MSSVSSKQKINRIFNGKCNQNNICPVKDIMARFGDKWSIYTVLQLGQHGKMRFNELKQNINGISQRMLVVTLRSLEEDGIVSRTSYPEIPPRVEYELTQLGEGLLKQLLHLATWADENFREIMRSRKKYQGKTAV